MISISRVKFLTGELESIGANISPSSETRKKKMEVRGLREVFEGLKENENYKVLFVPINIQ